MIVDTYMVYSIIRRLVKPFRKWKAYDLGIIDQNGNVLKKDLRTIDEKRAFTMMDRLILNLKKIIPSNSQLSSYAAAMFLIKEGQDYVGKELSEEFINERLEIYETYILELQEEAPTNSAGAGAVDGIGVGEKGEPGFSNKAKDKYKRRNKMYKRKELEEK